jgi:hypothetical protein
MATIELSSAFMTGRDSIETTGFCYRMIKATQGASSSGTNPAQSGLFVASSNFTYSKLKIMKGTMPSDFTSLTTETSRSTDVLWSLFGGSTDYYNTITYQNPIKINSYLVTATTTGTATWFWMGTFNSQGINPAYQGMIGTVGLTGSGADLEIADVNIVSGNQYKIVDLKIQFPSVWTY